MEFSNSFFQVLYSYSIKGSSSFALKTETAKTKDKASRRKSHSVSTSPQSLNQKLFSDEDRHKEIKEEGEAELAEKSLNELRAREIDEILDLQDTERPPSPSLTLLNQLERTDLAPELHTLQAPIPPPPPVPQSLV